MLYKMFLGLLPSQMFMFLSQSQCL